MPRMSDDVERYEGGGVGFRFKAKCKAVKESQHRILVLKQGCKCGGKHAFQSQVCKDWNWKVHEELERVIEGVPMESAAQLILGDKCKWELLVPVEQYLKGWGVSRDWKFVGIFDRKGDMSAAGFKSTEEMIFALLKKEVICNERYKDCDHRMMEVRSVEKAPTIQETPTPTSAPVMGDLLPMYGYTTSTPTSLDEKGMMRTFD